MLLDVDQFYGIEIEEFPAQIAQVAMWLMDHQMNLLVAEQFGENIIRLPLKKSASIVHGNALRIDWNDVVSADQLSYIMGNPPFIGQTYQNAEQKKLMREVFGNQRNIGILDFVTAWFAKSADYMQDNTKIRCGFVATNSIAQGEQVSVLWSYLLARQMKIHFAHPTFKWSNDGKGVAAVHCVIVGFGFDDGRKKLLFEHGQEGSVAKQVSNSSPYLFEGSDLIIGSRSAPISKSPPLVWGNKPVDGGNLILERSDLDELLENEPLAAKYVKKLAGAREYINGIDRWCLWLVGADPGELRRLPMVTRRIEAVREMRNASIDPGARALASRALEFRDTNNPSSYLVIPSVSSERRRYVPIGLLDGSTIPTNLVHTLPDAGLFEFGVLTSDAHMAWMRAVAGRLKSDYRYSKDIVYNNFPWPEIEDDKIREAIEQAAQVILDTRAQFPNSTLADLYDPNTMPSTLVRAHQQLDKAVDAAYIAAEKGAGRQKPDFSTEASRVAFLFERYEDLTSVLALKGVKKTRRRKVKTEQPDG